MSLLALIKTPKFIIPVVAIAASTPLVLKLDVFGRNKPFKNKKDAVLASISDRKTLKDKEQYKVKPFPELPEVSLIYTSGDAKGLETRANEWGYEEKVKDLSVSKKDYAAWCDGLYVGEWEESKQEVKTWKEKCGKDSKKRSHVNFTLRIAYPEGYYEKDSEIRKAIEEDKKKFENIEAGPKKNSGKEPIIVPPKACGYVFEKTDVQEITAPISCNGKNDELIAGTQTTPKQ